MSIVVAKTQITASSVTQTRVVSGQTQVISVNQVTTGLTGSPGSYGVPLISTEPDNVLRVGSDDRLFVPAPQLESAQW